MLVLYRTRLMAQMMLWKNRLPGSCWRVGALMTSYGPRSHVGSLGGCREGGCSRCWENLVSLVVDPDALPLLVPVIDLVGIRAMVAKMAVRLCPGSKLCGNCVRMRRDMGGGCQWGPMNGKQPWSKRPKWMKFSSNKSSRCFRKRSMLVEMGANISG